MSATAPYFFFSLITSIVTSLIFRKHEPSVSTFTAVCGSFCLLMFSIYVMTTPEPSVFCAFVFILRHLTVYIVSLTLVIAEYRLSSRHPLARFPGPTMAKLTKWYMVYHVLKGDRHTTLQQFVLFHFLWTTSKPLLNFIHNWAPGFALVGPNELSVNDARAVRPIYVDLSRASSYRGVPAHDDTLIMIIDRQRHARRRKPWAKAFSTKMLTQYSGSANKRADQLSLALLECKEPVDLHHWLALCLMDIIGDLGFSGGIETLAAGRDLDGWMTMLNLGALIVAALAQIPWLTEVFLLLPQKGPIETFHQFARRKVESAGSGVPSESSILSIILNTEEDSTCASLSEGEAAADASLLIASSIETTSQALTTLFRYVLDDTSVLQQLKAEIISSFGGGSDPISVGSRDTHKTPYLNACVQEALRIMPPVPAGLPRSTGCSGATVLKNYVPPHTTIHVPTYALQHDSVNFAHTNLFLPERWLPSESKVSPHNGVAYVPFGVGFGACVGRQLALQNIRIIAIHLLYNLDITFAAKFSSESFDASYKDHNIWTHDEFLVNIKKQEHTEMFGR